nr:hypothetical protein [Methanobrevibacter arboriphilus]
MLYIVFLSFFSLFDVFCVLLLFIPLNFLFLTLITLSMLFLFEHIWGLNIVGLFSLYCPFLALFFNGIWSKAFISSFIHFLISSVSYALSASI